MSDILEYILDREFDAPRELVWKAWSDPKILARWYGPGIETIIHEFDLKPGGIWRNEMIWGEKSDLSQMTFQEVIEGEKMTWHHSSTDADWNVIANPMMEGWPRTMLTTVTFEDAGGKTNVRLTMIPVDATEDEMAFFKSAMANMDGGWGSGYKIIDEILGEMQG